MTAERARAILAYLLICLMWSSSGLIVRSMSAADSWQINALRTGTAGVLLSLWLAFLHRGRLSARLRGVGPQALLAIFLSFAAGTNLFIYALKHTTVANTACLVATSPFWAMLLAWWRLGERPSRRTLLAACLALAGAATMVGQGLAVGGEGWRGDLAALCLAIAFAFQLVNLRAFRREELVPAFALAGLLTGGLLVLVRGGMAELPAADLGLGLLLGLVQMTVPTILMVWTARWLTAVEIALLSLLDTVLNPFWVFLFLGEAPSPLALLGGVVILTAVVLAVARRDG
ncbi:MAG: DMT family transporter [Geminicoccaceae bacterium]|nr:DMT family transporter [Geminicoccaceae bacterium]